MRAEIVATNHVHDIAALKVNGEVNVFSVFRQTKHQAGETAFFADYTSKAGQFRLKTAAVLPDEMTNQSSVWFSNRVTKGNSGAPLMDVRGYLLGMVRSYNYTGFNPLFPETVYNSAIALNALKYFLYMHNIMYYELPKEEYNLFEETLLKENIAVGILCAHKGRQIYLSY